MAEQNPLKPLFKDIADAIREKDGTIEPIEDATNFPARIRAIPSSGVPEGVWTITVEADPPEGGSVSGGGMVSEGMDVTATVSAVPDGEYEFIGWEVGGEKVSGGKNYTFSVTANLILIGKFSIQQYVAGRDWWAASLPSNGFWRSVTYGDGKFVAVNSNADKAAYSADGITWVATTMPVSAGWMNVAYGNGRFVAVAGKNTAAYSTDGITWFATTMPSSSNWSGVTYGDGKFVAVANGGNTAAYSTDGITWALSAMPSSSNWNGVTYGDGKFVAVNGNTDKAAYSTDGITWTLSTMPSSSNWYSVSYGNGEFVAVANNYYYNRAAYSSAQGPAI